MTTSGVTTLTVQFQEIATDALFLIGALEEGESITGEHTTAAKRAANMMFKSWQAHGTHLFAKTEAILFLEANQKSYVLPTERCARDSFGWTTVDGDIAAGTGVIPVVSTTPDDMQSLDSADFVGVELEDGTRWWSTQYQNPNATTAFITDSLPSDVADGATVFWYTTQITKPLRLLGARRGQYDQNEVPLELVHRDVYTEQSSKSASSIPTMLHYAPQRTTGIAYIWPTSDSCRNVVWFTYERQLEIIDAVTDESDFPAEWQETIVWNLAWRLGPQYGAEAIAKAQALKPDALMMLEQMLQFDNDSDAIYFQP